MKVVSGLCGCYMDIAEDDREIRHQGHFGTDGTNVNFAHLISDNELKMRPFERGVENEILACGTGFVVSAISAYLKKILTKFHI